MKLVIVYDNDVFKKGLALKSDWGFSCLIKTKDENILFDTGTKGELLLSNMEKLNIDPASIDKIVISHEHHDHRGGLDSLIPYLKDVKLYHLGKDPDLDNIVSIVPEIPKKINSELWTTGRIKGLVDEQSLVFKINEYSWYVLTGCSHPGVEKILNVSNEIGTIKGIIGGFHGFNNFNVIEDLEFICPCHCTSHKDDIKKAFSEKSYECGVGKEFIFGDKK